MAAGAVRSSRLRRTAQLWTALCFLVLFLAYLLFFAAMWFVTVYGDVGFDSILFTLQSSMSGVQSGLIRSYLLGGLLPAVLSFALTVLVVQLPLLREELGRRLLSLVLSGVLVAVAGHETGLWTYLQNRMVKTELYASQYVDPKDVQIAFPEEKRNLIYLFLESMEISYLSQELGGALDANIIPELYDLALENVNFSHNDGVGGFHATNGASWTIGAMVAHTAGVPLKTPSGNQNDYGNKTGSSVLPGLTTLTSILEENGYYTSLMVGSDANFGGRKSYFTTHGADAIYDLYTARTDGIIAPKYFNWWGYEDFYLFDYAKQELTELSQREEPFAFTMLTVDTHHVGGCLCQFCGSEREEQYENVISCSSRQVLEFVRWLQAQPFYENTTVVIVGDHLSMDRQYFQRNVDDAYDRLVYNCILNSPEEPLRSKNRDFTSLDLFPTTLAALGCQIEGNRLGFGTNLFSPLPTLSERMGYEEFNAELAKASEYYETFYVEP